MSIESAHPSVHRRGPRTATLVLASVSVLALAAVSLTVDPLPAHAADAPVTLGTAKNFSVLAGSTVTNTGPSFLGQDLGVHPGSAVTGFPPGVVGGAIHPADAVALQAKNDLTTGYNDAEGRTPFTPLAAELGGSTLTAGAYRLPTGQITGDLTLDAQGDPAAVFIFQVNSTLVTASNSRVLMINGASSCNVYWQVGSSATIGTDTTFIGTVMASTSITMTTGATLVGRALAQTGAVTLDSNTITSPACDIPTDTPTDTSTDTDNPTDTPTDTVTDTVTDTASDTPTDTATDDVPSDAPSDTPTDSGSLVPTTTPPATSTDSLVTATAGQDSPAPGAGGELPETGSGPVVPLVVGGALLLALGLVLVALRRRGLLDH